MYYLDQNHPPLIVFICLLPETTPTSDVVETTECYQGRGEGYRGTVDVLPTGLICQRWDSQYPHNHTFIPQAYPCKWVRHHPLTHPPAFIHIRADYSMTFSVFTRDLRENYCRNPDGREFPWCFTTDPRVRTMFCTNIPQCGTRNKPGSGERLSSFMWCPKQQGDSLFYIPTREHFYIFIFGGWVHRRPSYHTYWFVTTYSPSPGAL